MATEIKPLDIDGLKVYKKQNPVKFFRKFGDIDLDNLPEDFSIEVQKMKMLSLQPKTPLIDFSGAVAPKRELTPSEIVAEIARLTAKLPATVVEEKKEVEVNDVAPVSNNVEGGSTLENKEEI